MNILIIINSIAGFTLLSSCSARPLENLVHEAPHASSVKSLHATNDAHPWRVSAADTSHSHSNQQGDTPSLEEEAVNRQVEHVEKSLKKLRSNRVVPSNYRVTYTPSNVVNDEIPDSHHEKVSRAVESTVLGINHEIDSYKALAEGRGEDATQLLRKAADAQQHANSLNIGRGPTTLLIDLTRNEAVAEDAQRLEEQVQRYESLPTKRELLAVIQSLGQDHAAKVSTVRPATNQDKLTSAKNQDISSSAIDQGTSKFVENPEREPLLKNQDRPSVKDGPQKSWIAKVVKSVSRFHESLRKEFKGAKYTIWTTVSKHHEWQALEDLLSGNRAEAVEEIILMDDSRKKALLAYKNYQDSGYGTIDLEEVEEDGGTVYKSLQKKVANFWSTKKTDLEISTQRMKEIKEMLQLHDI